MTLLPPHLPPSWPLSTCGWMWVVWVFCWVVSANFTLKMKKNETLARLQHTIPTTFGMVALFHHGNVPELDWGVLYYSTATAIMGIAMTFVGLVFSGWARVHLGKYWSGTVALKEGHRLIISGPYAFVRHPIYTGLLTAVLGTAFAVGTKEAFTGFIVMIPAYILKWRREEKLMRQEFGQEYADYAARSKAIIPFVI